MLKKLSVLLFALFCTITYAEEKKTNETKKSPQISEVTKKQMKKNRKAAVMAFISFNKGSANIPAGEKRTLKKAVEEGKKLGDIENIDLAVWPDHELFQEQKKVDKEAAINLVESRISNIESVLKNELKISQVDTINMASEDKKLADKLQVQTHELKSLFAKKEKENRSPRRDLRVYSRHGGPSKGILIIYLNNISQ